MYIIFVKKTMWNFKSTTTESNLQKKAQISDLLTVPLIN